jgi:hypothetical protein
MSDPPLAIITHINTSVLQFSLWGWKNNRFRSKRDSHNRESVLVGTLTFFMNDVIGENA